MPKRLPKFPVLAPDDYYTERNPHLSNSRVSDFLLSREYYYRKHVLREVKDEKTDSMEIGSMVDAAFTAGSLSAIDAGWRVKLGKGDESHDGKVLVTAAKWEKAQAMAKAVLNSDWYAQYRSPHTTTSFQVTLTAWVPLGGKRKASVCGRPDAVTFDEKAKLIYVDDLKTSAPAGMRNPTAWYWHCLEFGYFRQLAAYRWMLSLRHPGWRIVCRHAVVSNSWKAKPVTRLFVVPERILAPALNQFFGAVEEIHSLRPEDFVDAPVRWEDAVELTVPAGHVLPLDEDESA